MLVKPSLPNVEVYKTQIDEHLKTYSKLAKKDINLANAYLSNSASKLIGKLSFNEILYIFQQVLITHFLFISENPTEAAKKMGIKQSTFCMYRKRKGPSLLLKSYKSESIPIDWR